MSARVQTGARASVLKDRHYVPVAVGTALNGEVTGVHPGIGSPALAVSLDNGQTARCELRNTVGGEGLLKRPAELLAMKGKKLLWIVTHTDGDKIGVRESGSESARRDGRH
jgi:hypothetical protein